MAKKNGDEDTPKDESKNTEIQYATKTEFDGLKDMLTSLSEKIDSISSAPKPNVGEDVKKKEEDLKIQSEAMREQSDLLTKATDAFNRYVEVQEEVSAEEEKNQRLKFDRQIDVNKQVTEAYEKATESIESLWARVGDLEKDKASASVEGLKLRLVNKYAEDLGPYADHVSGSNEPEIVRSINSLIESRRADLESHRRALGLSESTETIQPAPSQSGTEVGSEGKKNEGGGEGADAEAEILQKGPKGVFESWMGTASAEI